MVLAGETLTKEAHQSRTMRFLRQHILRTSLSRRIPPDINFNTSIRGLVCLLQQRARHCRIVVYLATVFAQDAWIRRVIRIVLDYRPGGYRVLLFLFRDTSLVHALYRMLSIDQFHGETV
jgi:hypothetical protein